MKLLADTLTPVCCSFLYRQGVCCDLDIMYIIGVYTNCSSSLCTLYVYYYPKKHILKETVECCAELYRSMPVGKYLVSNRDYSLEQLLPLKDRLQSHFFPLNHHPSNYRCFASVEPLQSLSTHLCCVFSSAFISPCYTTRVMAPVCCPCPASPATRSPKLSLFIFTYLFSQWMSLQCSEFFELSPLPSFHASVVIVV